MDIWVGGLLSWKVHYDGFGAEDLSVEVGKGHLAMGLSEECLATYLSEGCYTTDFGEGWEFEGSLSVDLCYKY